MPLSSRLATQDENPGQLAGQVRATYDWLTQNQYTRRLWAQDAALWSDDAAVQAKIANRLGWLNVIGPMRALSNELIEFAKQVKRSGIKHVVLLGMGGSSLCPEVCARTFEPKRGWPKLIVLDTTSPDVIRAARRLIDPRTALFISASKSGSTIETDTLTAYFLEELTNARVKTPGQHFIAITDPGSPLVQFARQHQFRRVFENPADIGGRYSALSLFGLVPMALIGIDVGKILERAAGLAKQSRDAALVEANTPVRLGGAIGACARGGRDKLTFVLGSEIASFGLWVEQLIAESTGKDGVGIVPVIEPKLRDTDSYGDDRVFVAIGVERVPEARKLKQLEKRGVPVIRIYMRDVYDLGAQFLRWEIATATAGAILGINPFDEPNVAQSKQNTSDILAEFRATGEMPRPPVEARLGTKHFSVALTQAAAEPAGQARDTSEVIRRLLQTADRHDYVAVLAYIPMGELSDTLLEHLRKSIAKPRNMPVTVGYGPRYLHSTGQLHKGGANNGVFILLLSEPEEDAAIPGRDFTFANLFEAQALGDFRSLDGHGRRAVLVRLAGKTEGSLRRAVKELGG